jgi:GNAT superfamily N-acetyltransferase
VGWQDHLMRVILDDGYELDDDPSRIDVDVVHRSLSEESYWAAGRTREVTDAVVASAARVVGLYHDDVLVGFTRTVSDGHVHSYLADVFVLPGHRGRGLGVQLLRFTVDDGPLSGTRWILHTADAQGLYEKSGFGAPGERLMERGGPPAGA